MRVLVFEPQYAGHNLAYVHHLAERLLALDCEVHLVTSSQAIDAEEFASHLGDLIDSLQITALDTFSTRGSTRSIRVNGPSGLFGLWRSLDLGLRSIEPDHLFVPFGNPIASCAGIPNPISSRLKRKGVESEIVLLSGKYAHPQTGRIAKMREQIALMILDRGPWSRIHHIVPHAVRAMKNFSSHLDCIATLLPDPVDKPPEMTKEQARVLLGIPAAGRLISLAGLLERRKGVAELLGAFEQALPKLRQDDRVLLAGKATPEIRELLATRYSDQIAEGRIQFLNRHLSNEELWGACIAADLVCTPYPHQLFSASIVIRAARVGVPVLANAIGWMQQTISLFGLGTTCDTLNPEVFSNNLVTSLDASGSFNIGPAGQRFLAFHTPENFASRLTRRVAERVGRRDYAPEISWEEVLSTPCQILQSA
ncbi:MAG: glycosyltransferase [Planctomycetes bacterium]|nr:glycosyltransferase [Planctomycetota bacterium]